MLISEKKLTLFFLQINFYPYFIFLCPEFVFDARSKLANFITVIQHNLKL